MQSSKPSITIIVPAYNEAKNLPILCRALSEVLSKENFCILIVDDGSSDDTIEVLQELSKNDSRINFLSFSRNFGHQYAIKAGFDYADGDIVITMDADMQHPPSIIPLLLEKYHEGFDVVNTVRNDAVQKNGFKKYSSALFYKILNKLSGLNLASGFADFRLLNRQVVDVCKGLNEGDYFWRGLIPWLGFNQTNVPYTPEKRLHGTSKYTLKKMIKLAMTGVLSFSVLPLRLTTMLGLCTISLTLLYLVYIFLMLIFGNTIQGWTSLIVSVLLMGGVSLCCIGILGEYVAKIHMALKKRPSYILKKIGLGEINEH